MGEMGEKRQKLCCMYVLGIFEAVSIAIRFSKEYQQAALPSIFKLPDLAALMAITANLALLMTAPKNNPALGAPLPFHHLVTKVSTLEIILCTANSHGVLIRCSSYLDIGR